jgi:hypothetical protein
MDWSYDYVQTAAGVAGSGTYLFPLPSGYSIDLTRFPANTIVGVANMSNIADESSSASDQGNVYVYDANNLVARYASPPSATDVLVIIGSSGFQLSNTVVRYRFKGSFAIAQWTTNINLATDFTEYASNSDVTSTASVTGSGFLNGFGNWGTFGAAWATGTSWIRRVKFQRPIQWGRDAITLGGKNITPGNIYDDLSISGACVRYMTLGGNTYGYTITQVASDPYSADLTLFAGGRVSTNATYALAGAPWSDMGTGWNWWVRKVSNGNMAEVPPVVRAEYYNQITTASSTNLIYNTRTAGNGEDTHSAYSTTTGLFTAPISGVYLVVARVLSGGAGSLYAMKSGSVYRAILNVTATTFNVTYTIRLNAGETTAIQSNTAVTADGSGFIQITRIGS